MKISYKIAIATFLLTCCSTILVAESSPQQRQKDQIQRTQQAKAEARAKSNSQKLQIEADKAKERQQRESALRLCKAAWERESWAEARSFCKAGADAGDGNSAYLLGLLYLHGNGVEKNPRIAADILENSVKLDPSLEDSIIQLAEIYISDDFGIKNTQKSINYLNICTNSCITNSNISKSRELLDYIYVSERPDLINNHSVITSKIKENNIFRNFSYYLGEDNQAKVGFYKQYGINLFNIKPGKYEGRIRFISDSASTVGGCYPVVSSGNKDFDALLCKIASGNLGYVSGYPPLIIDPALDASGNPVRSILEWSYSVPYRITDTEYRPLTSEPSPWGQKATEAAKTQVGENQSVDAATEPAGAGKALQLSSGTANVIVLSVPDFPLSGLLEKAGLLSRDLIVGINDITFKSESDANQLITSLETNKTYVFNVVRQGKYLNLTYRP